MNKEKAIHIAYEIMTEINIGDFTRRIKVTKIEILFNHIFKYIQFFIQDMILMKTMEKKLLEFNETGKFPRGQEYLDKLYKLTGKCIRKSARLENKRKIQDIVENNMITKRKRIC